MKPSMPDAGLADAAGGMSLMSVLRSKEISDSRLGIPAVEKET
jgi:hypothetical protein